MTGPENAAFTKYFDAIARFISIIAGYALIALSIAITVDVIGRKLFARSSIGTDELGGYVVAIMAAFGFTYALLEHAHTRIDLLYNVLSPRLKAVNDFVAMLALAIYAVFIAWRGFETLMTSIEFRSTASTPLHTPQWIPQSIWVAGLLIFAVATSVLAIHAAYLVYKRRWSQSRRLYGPQSLEDAIEQEKLEIGELEG